MKQTVVFSSQILCSGSAFLALALFSFTTLAQAQSTDSLRTSYGSRALSELTEKATNLQPVDLNKGLITSPEQLLTGQVAGLRIIPGGGAPGAVGELVLRSGTSIFGSNAPLVVLDGIPLELSSASSHAGLNSFINPSDIASLTLLKDAASLAVFGGNAANGVLYITTKQATRQTRTKLNYTATGGVSELTKKANILSSGEFRDLVSRKLPGQQEQLLGSHDTDWQDVIYRRAFSHDQNLSLAGSLLKTVPYRISLGLLDQQGILETSSGTRKSVALSLNPSLLKDHLRLHLQLRKVNQSLNVADERAIPAAWMFDPTQPVYQQNKYGGYFTYEDEEGNLNTLAPRNPLSLLRQANYSDETNTFMGQAHLQYSLHFFPALSLNARYAFQKQQNEYSIYRSPQMASAYSTRGYIQTNESTLNWKQLEAFVLLEQPIQSIQSNVRFLAGALNRERVQSRQMNPAYNEDGAMLSLAQNYSENTAVNASLFTQASLHVKNRYTLEAALAKERSSSLPNTMSTPLSASLGASWGVAKERFMQQYALFTRLQLYTNYSLFSKPDNSFVLTQALNEQEREVEKTRKINIGISWGVLQDRLEGDFNVYHTKATNLAMYWLVAAGTGWRELQFNNAGFTAAGLEANLRYKIIQNQEVEWSLGTNFSFMRSEMGDFDNLVLAANVWDGRYGLALLPGKPLNSFYLYEQRYDAAGKPIEGGYKTNQQGQPEKQAMHSAEPDFLFGLSSELTYKRFSAGFLVRGTAKNYSYNLTDAHRSVFLGSAYGYLVNVPGSYPQNDFERPPVGSSHFLENSSFLRMEYLQLAYDFGKVIGNKVDLRVNASLQNAFVLTRYSGQNPEVRNGVDYGQYYPQPRTFSLGLNMGI